MDKPIIGIVPTIKNQENPYQDKSSFVNMYAEKILSSGGIPLGMLTRNVDEYLSICDGYLWPGGNKIEWSYYISKASCRRISSCKSRGYKKW